MVRSNHEETEPLMNDEERYRDRHSSNSSSSGGSFELTGRRNAAATDEPQGENATSATSSSTPSKKQRVTTTTRDVTEGSSSSTGAEDSHPDAPLGETTGPIETTLQIDEEHDSPTPRFYQDAHAWKSWKWVPYPARRVVSAVVKWSYGPPNPRPYKIKPLFPTIQEYPLRLVDRYLPKPKWRFWFMFFYLSIWLVTFVLVKRSGYVESQIDGWGEPQDIDCGVTYWGKGNTCGFEGTDCRPFSNSGFAFRCPAGCLSYNVLNPRAVGDQEINYSTFVIGGESESGNLTYRGDSFICQAAMHAGITTEENGGCGVVYLTGQHHNYKSSKNGGVTSVAFDSYFPSSFTFVPADCASSDKRWDLLAVSAVFTGMLSLFTSSPALFFFPTFTGIFWTVGMALDSPGASSVTSLFSIILGRFLPSAFVAWVMFDKMGVRRTLTGLTAQIEKSLLWLGPCWVGAMDNYTFSFIPIQRLNGHDLKQQPGAIVALTIIIILLSVIIVTQVFYFRQEGRFIKYIKLYGLLVGAIVISLILPGLSLRIHHYILALLLLPGTSMQTRPSLIYQGVLIGLFINGIARWNYDSVLQTPDDLQGDAQLGTGLPTILDPVISLANHTEITSNITFKWKPTSDTEWDGLSVLVNDVERFRTYFDDDMTPPVSASEFTWSRNSSLGMPEYFRFGFLAGTMAGDYTQAGTWTADGKWVEMKPGPSKRKRQAEPQDKLVKRRR